MNTLLFTSLFANIIIYIGPGIGGGLLSVIIAFIISLLTFLVAIIWYPIKKFISIFKKSNDDDDISKIKYS